MYCLGLLASKVFVESHKVTPQYIQVNFLSNLHPVGERQTGSVLVKCPADINMTFTLNGHQMDLHLEVNRKLDPHLLPLTISDVNSTQVWRYSLNVRHSNYFYLSCLLKGKCHVLDYSCYSPHNFAMESRIL